MHVIAGVKNDQTQHIARMVNVHNRQREGAWFTGTSGTRRRLHSATRSTGICNLVRQGLTRRIDTTGELTIDTVQFRIA